MESDGVSGHLLGELLAIDRGKRFSLPSVACA